MLLESLDSYLDVKKSNKTMMQQSIMPWHWYRKHVYMRAKWTWILQSIQGFEDCVSLQKFYFQMGKLNLTERVWKKQMLDLLEYSKICLIHKTEYSFKINELDIFLYIPPTAPTRSSWELWTLLSTNPPVGYWTSCSVPSARTCQWCTTCPIKIKRFPRQAA